MPNGESLPPTQEEDRRSSLQEARQRDGARARLQKGLRGRAASRMASMPPNLATYTLVGTVAVLNDVIDWLTGIASVSGIWAIILRIIDLFTAAILWYWAFTRGLTTPKRGGKQGIVSRRLKRWIGWSIVEFVIGEISPSWTLAVIGEYREHKKAFDENERSVSRESEGARYAHRQEKAPRPELSEEAA